MLPVTGQALKPLGGLEVLATEELPVMVITALGSQCWKGH